MRNIKNLLKGELNRLVKYNIILIGVLVSVIWVLIIGLSKKEEITELLPVLMGMDATMMSIILLAASFYYEKQEGSINSIFVSPVKVSEVLITKIISAFIVSLISASLVYLTAFIVHKISINVILLLIYLIIIIVSHTAIGYVITLFCKDFDSMLGIYAAYAFIAIIPSMLYTLKVLPEVFGTILLISPSHAAQMLLNSLFMKVDLKFVIISIIYLVVLGFVLYTTVVYKKFKRYSVEG